MKKIQLLAAAAGIVLAFAGPSLAASRTHHRADFGAGYDAYASGSADRSGAYYYGPAGPAPRAAFGAETRFNRTETAPQSGYGPYPDRPYGDPDSW